MVLTSMALIMKSIHLPENQRSLFLTSSRVMFFAGIVVLLVGLTPIGVALSSWRLLSAVGARLVWDPGLDQSV